MRRRNVVFAALAAVVVAGVAAFAVTRGGDDKVGDTAAPSSTTTSAVADTQSPAPLTGLPMAAGKAARPLLIVKIDNDAAARPQAGLNEADVVVEQMVEGGATRFAALFHSTDAEVVGPVRSARSTDVNFASSFNRPLFAYSGASSVFEVLLRKSVFIDVGADALPAAYARRKEYKAPSNLFTSTAALYDGAKFPGTTPTSLWQTGTPGPGDAPAAHVGLVFSGPAAIKAAWDWDAATSSWVRTQLGTPHLDRAGARVSAKNVIVHFANYKDSAIRDRSGAAVPEAELVGKGDAWFFVDGKIVRGTWEKPSLTKPTEYKDGAGQPIVFAAGRTWIELLPPGNATVR